MVKYCNRAVILIHRIRVFVTVVMNIIWSIKDECDQMYRLKLLIKIKREEYTVQVTVGVIILYK